MRAVAPGAGPVGPGAGRGGRWIWGVSGVITAVALGVPGVLFIARPGLPGLTAYARPQHSVTRTVTVGQRVSGVTVDSYGAPVSVQSGDVSRVRVIETTMWSGTEPAADVPAVTQTVTGGQLTLASPRCAAADSDPGPAAAPPAAAPPAGSALPAGSAPPAGGAPPAGDCEIEYDVVTPPGVHVSVSSSGGPVTLSGADSANVDSGGGFVSAAAETGALTVTSDGGLIRVDGLAGALNADSGGGPVVAQGLSCPTATIVTGGGAAFADYTAPPRTVTIRTDSGPVQLGVPGGPYALTADSDGGPETLGIPVNTTASRSITVSTGGGMLVVGSPGTTVP